MESLNSWLFFLGISLWFIRPLLGSKIYNILDKTGFMIYVPLAGGDGYWKHLIKVVFTFFWFKPKQEIKRLAIAANLINALLIAAAIYLIWFAKISY